MPDLDFAEMERQEAEEHRLCLCEYCEAALRGDTAATQVTARRLGKSVAEVKADVAVLKWVKEQATKADGLVALVDEAESASDAWKAHQAETERIVAERQREDDRLYGVFAMLQHRMTDAQAAAGQLVALKQSRPDLFPDEPRAKPEPQAGPSTTGISLTYGELQPGEDRGPAVIPYCGPQTINGVLTYGAPVDANGHPLPDPPPPSPTPAATAVAEMAPPPDEEGDDDWDGDDDDESEE